MKIGSLIINKADELRHVGVIEEFSRDTDRRHREMIYVRFHKGYATWIDAGDLEDAPADATYGSKMEERQDG